MLTSFISRLVNGFGKSNTKLSSEQLEELVNSTYFDKKEIQLWYKGFLKDCPLGYLDQTEFTKIYKQYFPFGDPSTYSEYLFNLFDDDKDGKIYFNEFLKALSISSRGKVDEKLKWAFRLYDLNNDGVITEEEMLSVVSAIYEMIGAMISLPTDEDTPEKRVKKLFALMDKNNDGVVSEEEFKEGSINDKTILKSLQVYDGLV